MPKKLPSWSRQAVTATMLRRRLSSLVQHMHPEEVFVVTIDSCPRLALVDLQQFEELCYQAEGMRQ